MCIQIPVLFGPYGMHFVYVSFQLMWTLASVTFDNIPNNQLKNTHKYTNYYLSRSSPTQRKMRCLISRVNAVRCRVDLNLTGAVLHSQGQLVILYKEHITVIDSLSLFLIRAGERKSVQFPGGCHDCDWDGPFHRMVHSGNSRE